ncbi:hypothetical protein ACRALDRAFT_1077542 [Sodiomyces alcalophilus JCM 7366]|uniref:uncharacterized protein n=1 Tax=Sodiomyces alcalophilus JCM 7366 TaxID=591952 RepID=UPI0039B55253
MPPVRIHSSSPINAAKAQGTSPKTDTPEARPAQAAPSNTRGQDIFPTSSQPYPPPQPGARPAAPTQTGTTQASPTPPPPTRTQKQDDTGPPPPQPGAVPTLPGPRPGQTYQPPQPTPASTASTPFPAQMSVPSPTTSYSAQIGSGTSTSIPHLAGPAPVNLGSTSANNYSHPPGYQQNTGAANFSSYQQPAGQNSWMETAGRDGSMDETGDGVWDTAKRWARTAGENLAAAEKEVWRKINEK